MSDERQSGSGFRIGLGLGGLLGALAAVGGWLYFSEGQETSSPPLVEATKAQVMTACATCHAYPPPDCLPRSMWRKEVQRGFAFRRQANLPNNDLPPQEAFVNYYEQRAPAVLAVQPRTRETKSPPRFERRDYWPSGAPGAPAISNVRVTYFSSEERLDVLACDMFNGRILLLRPYDAEPRLQVLYEGLHQPAHVEVVDLDGDGVEDLLVANLGNFYPTNDKCGSVVWLRGSRA